MQSIQIFFWEKIIVSYTERNSMKVLVFGSTGFIGQTVAEHLSKSHEVHTTTRAESISDNQHTVDLLQPEAVRKVIELVQPEIIVNAAGIVDPNADTMQNVSFTQNILNGITQSNIDPSKVIIFGSAGEYGRVQPGEIPVHESVPLRAESGYGYAKKLEEEAALSYGNENDLPVIVARIFNPIGRGMAEKFLVSRLKKQIEEYKEGKRESLELNRKDSKRDYIAVGDIALAIAAIAEGKPTHNVYNIGSGKSMSNGDLLQLMVKSSKIIGDPNILETSEQPEAMVASEADITRISQDFNWAPKHSISATLEEIMND
jgi:GDP-4-dehydro-6-deoxy-D-mannose reductase